MFEEENRKKIYLNDFLEINERNIILIGVFIATLSIAFGYIEKINSGLAGYFSLVICLLIFLLILGMFPKEESSYSLPANLFFVGIVAISVIIFYIITESYSQEYDKMLNVSYLLVALALGGIVASKLLARVEKKRRKKVTNLIIFIFSLILWKFFRYFIGIPNYLSDWKYNSLIILFLSSFGFLIIIWGIIEGGIRGLGKEIFEDMKNSRKNESIEKLLT